MQKVTGYNLVSYINQLPRNRDYNYINPRTHGLIRIVRVTLPAGPIVFKRWNPTKGECASGVKEETISKEMIWRIANAFYEGQPINVDRILGASYNSRSVLEALIAYTPQFYYCFPGRILDIAGHTTVEHGHKHLLWIPSKPHDNGKLEETDIKVAISEIPTTAAVYDNLVLPTTLQSNGMDIEVVRRHAQIQIALYLIGLQLKYETWIAQNDKGIQYKGKPLIQHPSIISTLSEKSLIGPYEGAVEAGLFIDCIWFSGERKIPAIMEVEHTTGVTSGLNRIKNFHDRIPDVGSRYVIVAPDEDRELVVAEANKPMFSDLDVRYFPYSSVEELYVLCKRRNLRGVTEEFLDCYMEKVKSNG